MRRKFQHQEQLKCKSRSRLDENQVQDVKARLTTWRHPWEELKEWSSSQVYLISRFKLENSIQAIRKISEDEEYSRRGKQFENMNHLIHPQEIDSFRRVNESYKYWVSRDIFSSSKD